MKTVLKLLTLFAVFAYFIFAVVRYSTAVNENVCKSLSIDIADSAHANLISKDDIENKLLLYHLHPVGRSMTEISPLAIEQTLEKDSFIRHAMCVETPGEHVRIVIVQRIPLLRIIADNGENYYIDEEGTRMDAQGYEADLAVATGNIDPHFAKHELRELGQFLRNNTFWDEQVQQICVLPDHEVDLIMRVGDQIVHLGKVQNIEKKFRNLYAFYKTILPEVGWKRYSEISIAYENQVIGKKPKANKH